MQYQDRIYGETTIDEPVVLELIELPEFERLKRIDQYGYLAVHYPGFANSRFEHSVGVFLLLRKYQASLGEQVAGLIHDVSHSVFSHCTEYVLGKGSEKEQSHQDNIFTGYVRQSRIPAVLAKHGLDVEYILDDTNFPLKENSLPDLCADRLDYSFRDMAVGQVTSSEEIQALLAALKMEKGSWLFTDKETAVRYAELFSLLNLKYWSGLPTALMFCSVRDVLKYALQKKYISAADLYTTDDQVLDKIRERISHDEDLGQLFKRMNNEIKGVNDPDNYSSHVFCKSRVVDPLCQTEDGIKRVSEVYSQWAEVIKQESKAKEYFVRFL